MRATATGPVDLTCTPADVTAAALGVRWDGPLPEILADTVVDAGADGSLHLAVIGGSHVVTVRSPEGEFREEISCTATDALHPLPEEAGRAGYRLETRTETLEPGEFSRRGDELLDSAGADGWFVVRFPGPGRHHLTALQGWRVNGGWSWRTRHLYPEESTIVSTRSDYRP
ncbi:DUF2617 family protein [Corynebacterium halotolerans]|uniref:DUF2617 domain-containing protein n=1 Tax=Corynebacterium halotolerans YIM 70093 = DSM 44683 TaxID=1121362 RepID=M1NQ05_9CORY|nr:DUF2617 family protein [Corynebacterium halotolerans]AGF73463.1 hypothetical protein A605_12335 [Corynebacterium halotolerans YIM 70093 = DSM 44683]